MKALMLMAVILSVCCAACSKKSNPVDNGEDIKSRFTLSQPQLLIPNGREAEGSLDVQWIAYCGWSDATKQDIFIADKDGGNVRQITDAAKDENRPFWSPDGRHIGFSSNLLGNIGYNIFTISLDDGKIEQISPDTVSVQSGHWSPDGQLIVFDGQGERQAGNLLGLGISRLICLL